MLINAYRRSSSQIGSLIVVRYSHGDSLLAILSLHFPSLFIS